MDDAKQKSSALQLKIGLDPPDPPEIRQAKKDYMELLKQFRGKSKVDAMKDMNDDLDKFVKIHSRPKEFNHEDKGET